MDWLAAVLTLVSVELVARRRWQGWALMVVNAVLWGWLMWQARLWGFLALEGVLAVQAGWALYRWRR